MCVDDLVCQGAEPLFLLDYISSGVGGPVPDGRAGGGGGRGLPSGRRRPARRRDGRAPRASWSPASSTWSGFAVGVVERDEVLGPDRVRAGDVLIGLASPGLRCNGYTLARHVLLERAGLALDGPAWPGARGVAGRRAAPAVGALHARRSRAGHRLGGPSVPRGRPHHRWRVRGQPAPGPAPRSAGGGRPGRPGRSRRSSARSGGSGRSTTTRWPGCSTSASAWSWWSPRTATDDALEALPRAGRRCRWWWAGWRTGDRGVELVGPELRWTAVGRIRRMSAADDGERPSAADRIRGAARPPAGALGPSEATSSSSPGEEEQLVHRLEADGVPARGHGAGGRRHPLGDPRPTRPPSAG